MPDETKPDLPSTTDEAANPALDPVTDLVLDSTIPAPIRRNMFKAFGQLCSALIDVPVGALERRSAEKRAESEARIKIRNEITTQIIEQTKVDPAYALKAGHKFAEKIIQEQLNLDNISAIAADELKSIESNNATSQNTNEPNQEQSADSTNQNTNSSEEKTINDDWLNNFENEARSKSTKEMQLRFGRILAGEIEKPGSYSTKTVKLLGELDQSTAALFKKLCSACIVFEIPEANHVFDIRVSSLGGDAGQNALGKYGLGFDQLNTLNEYGLIISSYKSRFSYNMCIMKENSPMILPFQHQGRFWILSPLSGWQGNQDFMLSGVNFSHAGRELYRIVDQDPMPEYTADLKKFFEIQNLRMIEVPIR